MGPHTFNFSEAAELAQRAGAALRVATMEEGVRAALELVADESRRAAAVGAALAFAQAHKGAADKTADAVLALMPLRKGA
jgi:3-deoxy-D-manno-octulosonic-acid transferase